MKREPKVKPGLTATANEAGGEVAILRVTRYRPKFRKCPRCAYPFRRVGGDCFGCGAAPGVQPREIRPAPNRRKARKAKR